MTPILATRNNCFLTLTSTCSASLPIESIYQHIPTGGYLKACSPKRNSVGLTLDQNWVCSGEFYTFSDCFTFSSILRFTFIEMSLRWKLPITKCSTQLCWNVWFCVADCKNHFRTPSSFCCKLRKCIVRIVMRMSHFFQFFICSTAMHLHLLLCEFSTGRWDSWYNWSIQTLDLTMR